MTELCSDLVSFADGELDDERAETFRAHLATCDECQAGLLEAMQLNARLAALALPGHVRQVEVDASSGAVAVPNDLLIPPRLARSSKPLIDDSSSETSGRGQFAGLKILPRRERSGRKRSKWWAGGGIAGALVALVAVWFAVPPRPQHSPVANGGKANPFAKVTNRPYDIRIAYATASDFRGVRDVARGSSAAPRDENLPDAAAISPTDRHGQLIIELWNHHDLADLAAKLRALPQTPEVKSDLVAIESLTTNADNLEGILRPLEALQQGQDKHVARVAKWNYALQLKALDLSRGTAAAFSEIAKDREPGWAEDATKKSEEATKIAEQLQQRWQDANAAGEALWRTGALVPHDMVLDAKGLMRAYFYHAVRAAPSADRVHALAPMAAELDGTNGPPILANYVRRVEAMSFQRRAALAQLYAKALAHDALTPAEQRSLTTPTPSAEVADIIMGGMIELDAVTTHLDAFRALVKASNDPWFEIVLAKEAAKSDVQRGDWIRAESRLLAARPTCTEITAYQCLGLSRQLALVEQELHHVPAALKIARDALRLARMDGEWGHYRDLLFVVADIERFNHSTATARAYAQEFLLMAGEDCVRRAAAYQVIAGAALLDVDGATARRALNNANCRAADLGAANDLADIGRLDPKPGDLAKLRTWLGALRQGTTLTPGQRILADEIEGRLQIEIESERAGGTQLLERAIKEADALPDDVDADKARAAAYSVLIFSAANDRDYHRAFDLVAQTLGLATPPACAVAMNAEDERSVVIIRDVSGKDQPIFTAKPRPSTGPLVAAQQLAPALHGCKHVQVLALASLQGQPDILPRDVAWSYAIDRHRRSSVSPNAAMPQRTLIVMNVQPPAELNLPALRAVPLETTSAIRNVSGREATPSRVLAEMRDATEIQFHTHALVDVVVSDASLLVLSPDPDGHYALTAEAIRSTQLRGRPVVVLAACHSAQGANYQHAAWSLPDAFVAAGARAVFAAGTEIPDLAAGPFFNDVLKGVREGADPATALRDAREKALKAGEPTSWIADVMVFE